MTSTLVITIVVIAAIAWLAFLAVSALRSRGPEEVPSNLRPGESDEKLETRRVERAQQAAVLLSAFLAVGLPLYYLGENQRQAGFEEQFHEESIERGLHLWEEFGCGDCHGPDGSGGAASYVEARTGVTVNNWVAPSINDVFYRYPRDQVRYFVVFGRQNSPMPAWGLEGDGPMNDAQIEDVLNYLESIQIEQSEVVSQVESNIDVELTKLERAPQTMDAAILEQRQLIAELDLVSERAPVMEELSERAAELEENLSEGLDTDGDGVADTAEEAVNALTAEARQVFVPEALQGFALDPETADAQRVDDLLATMRELAEERAPILQATIESIEAVLEGETPAQEPTDGADEATDEEGTGDGEEGETADEGEPAGPVDTDADGLTDTQEQEINTLVDQGISELVPADIVVTNLDPTNPESTPGQSDLAAARTALSGLQGVALDLSVQNENMDRIRPPAVDSLDTLLELEEAARWEFDFQGIADHAFDGDVDKARRVVGLYQANCARCHTSGYSAGIPFAQEAGAGGFGPALWEGRPAVQFLSDEELKEFLMVGSVENEPYGVNGMGSGRMPGFGAILSEQDLLDLSHWLRMGNLTGQGDTGRTDDLEAQGGGS